MQASPDAKNRTLVLVDVNTAFLDSATERVNITVPRYALSAIDRLAKAQGLSRSACMVRSAKLTKTVQTKVTKRRSQNLPCCPDNKPLMARLNEVFEFLSPSPAMRHSRCKRLRTKKIPKVL